MGTRVLRGEENLALDSVKWLAKQRNSRGGFVSTQDTVVALQALSMYSQKVTRLPSKLELDTTGSGCAMVQTVLRYNVPDSPANAGFELSVEPTEGQLNVCAQYTGSREETGMGWWRWRWSLVGRLWIQRVW